MTDLATKVRAIMESNLDRQLAAEMVIAAVRADEIETRRAAEREKKRRQRELSLNVPGQSGDNQGTVPGHEGDKETEPRQSLNVRAEIPSGSDPDPDLEKQDLTPKGGAGGNETESAASKRQAKRAKKTDPDFAAWYEAYPRKVGIAVAWRAWLRLKASGELGSLEEMLAALEWQRRQPGWLKDAGAFIPHPATYLNGHRWRDQRPGGGGGGPGAPSVPVANPEVFTPPTSRGWRRPAADTEPAPLTFADLIGRKGPQ